MRRPTTVAVAAIALVSFAAPAVAAWSASGGGTGSSTARALTAGTSQTASASGSTVTITWVNPNPSGTSYAVVRSGSTAALSGCTTTSCTDSSVPAGTYTYTITPALSAWTGPGATTGPVTVNASPTVTVSFPAVDGAAYTSNGAWQNNCPSSGTGICGTAAAGTATLSKVELVLKRTVGSAVTYWNGTAWVAGSTTLNATGTASWLYPVTFASLRGGLSNGTVADYLATVTVTDTGGLTGQATRSFKTS